MTVKEKIIKSIEFYFKFMEEYNPVGRIILAIPMLAFATLFCLLDLLLYKRENW